MDGAFRALELALWWGFGLAIGAGAGLAEARFWRWWTRWRARAP